MPTPTPTPTPSNTPNLASLADQKLFTINKAPNSSVDAYTLTTFNTISSLTYEGSYDVSAQAKDPRGISIHQDGVAMFVVDSGVGAGTATVYKFFLQFPWTVSSVFYFDTEFYSVKNNPVDSGKNLNPVDLEFSNGGDIMYILDDNSDAIYQYFLADPYDLSNDVEYGGRFKLSNLGRVFTGVSFEFGDFGSKLYVVDSYNQTVNQYGLSTPWDITTCSLEKSLNVQSSTTKGISFDYYGLKMFLDLGSYIHSYNLGVAWDIGTAKLIGGAEKGKVSTYSSDIEMRKPETALITPTVTPTHTVTPTITASITPSATITPTPTATAAVTSTPDVTPTHTITPTVSASPTPTPSVTPSSDTLTSRVEGLTYVNTKTITATSYTLTRTDLGKLLKFTSNSAITLILPEASTEDLEDGFFVSLLQGGTGAITLTVEGTDTLYSVSSGTTTVDQYSITTVIKETDGVWRAGGSLL